MKYFFKYLSDLMNHAVNVYSVISFCLIFVTPLLPIPGNQQATIAYLLAFLSLLWASFFAWRDIYIENIENEIHIETRFVRLGSRSVNGAGVLDDYSLLNVDLDLINNTKNMYVLREGIKVEIDDYQKFFGENIGRIKFVKQDNLNSEVSLPYKIIPNDSAMLRLNIDIPVVEKNPLSLPVILGSIRDFKVRILLEISGQKGERKIQVYEIDVQVKQYVDEIVKVWKQHGYNEMYEQFEKFA